MRHIYIVIIRN